VKNLIGEAINDVLKKSGHSELLLSKSEQQIIDRVLEKPIDRYIWLAIVVIAILGIAFIVLPRVLIIKNEESKNN